MEQKKSKALPVFLWVIFGIIACAFALGLASYFTLKTAAPGTSVGLRSSGRNPFFHGSAELVRINLEGPIFESEELNRIYEALDDVESSKKIKGLLVRISSPGGSVAPTQEIYERLLKIREKIPVICSLGDIAASGGYYVASACHKIFANPGTLTGSIGVIMQLANLKDLYSWAKIKPFVIKSGRYKDMGSPLRELEADEKLLLDEILARLHKQFKNDIAKGRAEAGAKIEEYADGRIFSGEQALEYAFVDSLGGYKEALKHLREQAKVDEDAEIVTWPEEERDFRSFFRSQVALIAEGLNIRRALGVEGQLSLEQGVPYFLPSFWTGRHHP